MLDKWPSPAKLPETCALKVSALDGVDSANVVFHTSGLPDNVIKGWSYKSILRFHRGNARAAPKARSAWWTSQRAPVRDSR